MSVANLTNQTPRAIRVDSPWFIDSLQELIFSLIDDETAFVLDAIEGNRKEVGLYYHPFLFHI